jgi:hypothetical protein
MEVDGKTRYDDDNRAISRNVIVRKVWWRRGRDLVIARGGVVEIESVVGGGVDVGCIGLGKR